MIRNLKISAKCKSNPDLQLDKISYKKYWYLISDLEVNVLLRRLVLIERNAVYTTWHTNVKMAHKCKGKVTYYSKYDWTFHVVTMCMCVVRNWSISEMHLYLSLFLPTFTHACAHFSTFVNLQISFVWRIYSLNWKKGYLVNDAIFFVF